MAQLEAEQKGRVREQARGPIRKDQGGYLLQDFTFSLGEAGQHGKAMNSQVSHHGVVRVA